MGKLARARDTLLRWKADPVAMVRECFQAEPDPFQAEGLRLFADPTTERIAVKACKGPGKTTLLAWFLLNFMATRPYPKIAATSITEDNLNDNLWPEIAKWHGRSPFFVQNFAWTKTRYVYREAPDNWFATARSWPKTADADRQADTLAGIHADHVLFLLDESGGIPQAVMTTAEAVLATGVEAKVVQAGNPTHTTGPLYRACTVDRHLWAVLTVTGDPDSPRRSSRIKLEWARQQIASYGRDNPWVMVNVLGEFPPSSINALLGVEEVQRAMSRHLRRDQYDWAQKRLGVDVARFGDDRTVIFPRQGLAAFKPIVMRNARTTDIAARVYRAQMTWGAELVFVDDTGHWGHGVIDNLIAAGTAPVPLVYHAKALSPRFKNRRCEFWLTGAEAIRAGGALPMLPELVGELTEPTYTFVNGVFVLEEKAQIKERLGRSPDLADAYMQTHAMEDMPGELLGRLRQQSTAKRDFDPYAMPGVELPADGRADRDFDPLA
jgi:phage terminase large subunit